MTGAMSTESRRTVERERKARDARLALDRAVDAAGSDSFPASDPPAWWAGADDARASDVEHPDR
jgi:hypothetical protein